jgi:hypothetical protein
VVTLVSGPIYKDYGGLTYLMPAVLAAVSLVLALILRSGWQGGALWAGEEAAR